MGSKKFTLNISDFYSLGKNAMLVGGAAALTYIGANLGQLDLGTMGVLCVPIVAVAIDTAVKWMKNNSE
tara:strand:- start:121 stop:327 length:207 start_codon:yes stop_codon:yes gene_type:complete